MLRFAMLFLGLILFNFIFRFPDIFHFGFLNEDAAILRGALETVQTNGISYLFTHSLGAQMLRPFQILGFAAQHAALGDNPFAMHLLNLALFSFSQAMLISVLALETSLLSACIGILFLSVARAGAEPNYWLSDQHDQYLLLCIAFGLAISRMWTMPNSATKQLSLACGCFGVFWLGFLSNEKGIVVPGLLTIAVGALLLLKEGKVSRGAVLRTAAFASVGLLAIGSYFFYRHSVLGTYIGGYDDRLIPLSGFTTSYFFNWGAAALSTPFLQATATASHLSNGLAAIILLILIGVAFSLSDKQRKRALSVGILFFLIALIISTLPTYRHLHPHPHLGVFSTRMYWLPLITWAIGITALCHCVEKLIPPSSIRWFLFPTLLCLLTLSGYGGKMAQSQMRKAHDYTLDALAAFKQYCSCADPQRPSAFQLPMLSSSVFVFTEESWLEQYAVFQGMPECTSNDERCTVYYRHKYRDTIAATPAVISKSKLTSLPKFDELHPATKQGFFTLEKGLSKADLKLDRVVITVKVNTDNAPTEVERIVLYAGNIPIHMAYRRGLRSSAGESYSQFRMFVPVQKLLSGDQPWRVVAFRGVEAFLLEETTLG
ncbi:MAG: hypothetical protein KDD70_02055 [Bdellovibrionales bacterium]|nr:hypothetical protein [Bdellovibrionales bacterium]